VGGSRDPRISSKHMAVCRQAIPLLLFLSILSVPIIYNIEVGANLDAVLATMRLLLRLHNLKQLYLESCASSHVCFSWNSETWTRGAVLQR
jgi:hypothetical protein